MRKHIARTAAANQAVEDNKTEAAAPVDGASVKEDAVETEGKETAKTAAAAERKADSMDEKAKKELESVRDKTTEAAGTSTAGSTKTDEEPSVVIVRNN